MCCGFEQAANTRYPSRMASRRHDPSDILPRRRRYDAKGDPGKIIADLKIVVEQRRMGPHLPTWERLYRAGYENLGWAVRKIAYHELAEACDIPPDPSYYSNPKNLYVEVSRLFLSPQWDDVTDDDIDGFEPQQPSYAELSSQPELYEAILRAGGITKLFPLDDRFQGLCPSYYQDDGNLQVELALLMRRLRTKLMPTYSQVESLNERIPDAYLFRGGYLKTAKRLGLQPNTRYIRDAKNLWYELSLVAMSHAIADGRRILENGLPDFYFNMMVTEEEIREFRRTDLHHAVLAMGGYFHATKAINCWLFARFWEDNPGFAGEMRSVAKRLGHSTLMPTKDELRELGRIDLVRGIVYNGGVRRAAKMCGLRLQRSVRRTEKPLVSTKTGFEPYPHRRLSTAEPEAVGDLRIRYEVPADAKSGPGQVEEFGVWVFTADDPRKTLGRFGWIRRRPGSNDHWMYRLEGQSRWSGGINDRSEADAIRDLLQEAEISEQRSTHSRE